MRLAVGTLLLLSWFSSVVATVSCQKPPARPLVPSAYQGRQMVVGSGGGFTGQTTTYYWLESGDLFKKTDPNTDFTWLGKQGKAKTQQLLKQLETDCRIKTTTFNHPGNLYRFVRWQKGSREHTVTWGDNRQPAPADYVRFYNAFMALIPAAKPEQ